MTPEFRGGIYAVSPESLGIEFMEEEERNPPKRKRAASPQPVSVQSGTLSNVEEFDTFTGQCSTPELLALRDIIDKKLEMRKG